MKHKFKKILTMMIVIMLLAISTTMPALADTTTNGDGDVSAVIPVNGTINALTISVTHPATVSYSIDPNADAGNTFIAPDIQITNNTKVPISVALNSLASSAGGTIQFTDMDPYAQINWDNMGVVESKEYIALGLTLKDEMEWTFAGSGPYYSFYLGSSPSFLGQLGANNTAILSLVAKHGLAFDQAYTAMHTIELIFSLN